MNISWREAPRPPREPVITNLPGGPRVLVGRDRELREILDVTGPPRRVPICAIDGMPGVGKTALAVRAAHALAERFPDGQYFIDLHGHTPGRRPADPAEVLAEMLAALGVDAADIPPTPTGRRSLWRNLLSGTRTLLVLDDAANRGQVEPLLPSGDGCLTVVTSRRRLLLPDMWPISLAVLGPQAAEALFCTVAGRDPDGIREIVARTAGLCGYLPLAVGLVAGRVAHHPHWTVEDLEDLAAELAAETDRLSVVDSPDEPAVRAAFDLSYRDLPPERRLLFCRSGLHPGPDLEPDAVAALAGVDRRTARRELDALYTDHLLQETGRGRYRLHDLLRGYARTLAESNANADNVIAVDRLLDHYQRTAADADRWLSGRTRPTGTPVTGGDTVFADDAAALRWLRRERANLLACLEYCATTDSARTVALTEHLAELLILDGPWQQARSLHERAAEAAVRLGDEVGAAHARTNLGRVHNLLGDHLPARDAFRMALAVFRRRGDRLHEAAVHSDLGLMSENVGDYAAAADSQQCARARYRELGNRLGEAHTVRRLGGVHQAAGEYRRAADLLAEAGEIYREIGDRLGEAHTLAALGTLRQSTGDHRDAIDLLRQAANSYRTLENPLGEANTLRDLGLLLHIEGRRDDATALHQQAADIYRRLGNRLAEADALTAYGMAQWRTGDFVEAVHRHQHASAIFRESGNRLGEAETLLNLGLVYESIGQHDRAGELHQRALTIFEEIGNRLGVADALGNLGAVRMTQGHNGVAEQLHRQALEIFRELGSRLGEAKALTGLGLVCEGDEDFGTRAARLHRDALDLFRELGHRRGEAETLAALARVHRNAGNYDDATELLTQARDLYRRIGNRVGDVETLNGIGWLLLEAGRRSEALRTFTDALAAADHIHHRLERAHALEGSARCRTIGGDRTTAARHLAEAVTIYRGLGSPEADRAARYLARSSNP